MKPAADPFRGGGAALLMAAMDTAVFLGLRQAGVAWQQAHLVAFPAAVLSIYLFGGLYRRLRTNRPGNPIAFSVDLTIFLAVLFLRGGVLASLVDVLGVSPGHAMVVGAVFSSASFCWARSVWSPDQVGISAKKAPPNRQWQVASILFYVVLLRLLYASSFELLHEEGYYWLYAQYLDIGYLDHPPAVGWLIWLFTTIFGQSEFVIRLGAFACWLIATGYVVRLTQRLGGGAAGRRTLVLMGVLPVFFATGMVMTPDSPLVACWAAALYYLYRALVDRHAPAWLGVGIFMGLGLLSKYTMVLLGGAAWAFLLFTPEGRQWLKRPQPYLAVLLALALFSPVIVWNAGNGWDSFFFQGVGRHQGEFNFGLQDLIGSALILLTPVGLLTLGVIFAKRKGILAGLTDPKARRGFALLAYLTLLPLGVFFVFSLFRMSKLNWTAPIWLGALPYLALFSAPLGNGKNHSGSGRLLFPRLWPLTTAAVLVLYGGLLHYLVLGFPGLPYPQNALGIGKRSLARQIQSAQIAFEEKTGEKALVVCWDSERLASWLSYYLSAEDFARGGVKRSEAVQNITGAHVFGSDSKMFRYWHPPGRFNNNPLLMISDVKWELEFDPVISKVTPLTDVETVYTTHNRKRTGQYFYRFFSEVQTPLASREMPWQLAAREGRTFESKLTAGRPLF